MNAIVKPVCPPKYEPIIKTKIASKTKSTVVLIWCNKDIGTNQKEFWYIKIMIQKSLY